MATNTNPFPIINVVPAGYRWTAEAAKKAAEKGAFLRVGGTQVSRRFLTGATRSWRNVKPEEANTIFNTTFRITGTPKAVSDALAYAGYDQGVIDQAINGSITRNNYENTMKPQYDAEIAAYNAVKQKKPAAEGYQFQQILWFGQNIKTAVIATKTGEQRGAVASPGRVGTGETLAEKIGKLQKGKVLDVSNLDVNTGKGFRTIAAPKTAKSGKFGTERLPIISNDINKYIRAIELAYGPEGARTYQEDIDLVRRTIVAHGAPAVMTATMTATRVPSPRQTAVAPGQMLAPPPVFTNVGAPVPNVRTPTRVGNLGTTNFPPIPRLGQ